jgi:predicted nucleic acid-binding protein
LTATDLNRCRELIASYRDLDLRIADSAVVATAGRLGIPRLFTLDEHDFPSHEAGKGHFILLPADA